MIKPKFKFLALICIYLQIVSCEDDPKLTSVSNVKNWLTTVTIQFNSIIQNNKKITAELKEAQEKLIEIPRMKEEIERLKRQLSDSNAQCEQRISQNREVFNRRENHLIELNKKYEQEILMLNNNVSQYSVDIENLNLKLENAQKINVEIQLQLAECQKNKDSNVNNSIIQDLDKCREIQVINVQEINILKIKISQMSEDIKILNLKLETVINEKTQISIQLFECDRQLMLLERCEKDKQDSGNQNDLQKCKINEDNLRNDINMFNIKISEMFEKIEILTVQVTMENQEKLKTQQLLLECQNQQAMGNLQCQDPCLSDNNKCAQEKYELNLKIDQLTLTVYEYAQKLSNYDKNVVPLPAEALQETERFVLYLLKLLEQIVRYYVQHEAELNEGDKDQFKLLIQLQTHILIFETRIKIWNRGSTTNTHWLSIIEARYSELFLLLNIKTKLLNAIYTRAKIEINVLIKQRILLFYQHEISEFERILNELEILQKNSDKISIGLIDELNIKKQYEILETHKKYISILHVPTTEIPTERVCHKIVHPDGSTTVVCTTVIKKIVVNPPSIPNRIK